MLVLIIDDHPLYRRGVESLLYEIDASAEVFGAGSIDEGMAIAGRLPVDLILLDLHLPGMRNLDALIRIKELLPEIPTVVVSANNCTEQIWRAIEMGAAGYIPKDMDQGQMINALRRTMECGTFVPQQALAHEGLTPEPVAPPALSARQLDVLKLLLQGKPNKAIAHELGIAEGTAKAHLYSIYQALGVNSRTQAMVVALRNGLISRSFR